VIFSTHPYAQLSSVEQPWVEAKYEIYMAKTNPYQK